jgi:hypothetical protein
MFTEQPVHQHAAAGEAPRVADLFDGAELDGLCRREPRRALPLVHRREWAKRARDVLPLFQVEYELSIRGVQG